MAVINFVIPPTAKARFTGGGLCLLEYAKGLRARNHQVHLIPFMPCDPPLWFSGDFGCFPDEQLMTRISRQLFTLKEEVAESHGVTVKPADHVNSRLLSLELQLAFGNIFTREILKQLPAADATVATFFLTARPVRLYGTGKKFYFAQHFEPYFADEMPDPVLAEHEAMASYGMGLRHIANSSWLREKLKKEIGVEAQLCPNAIDHSIFRGAPKSERLGTEIRVISYGGRGADWKGFRDMAAGMRIARERMQGVKLRWQVYGSCILEPSNPIADYESLGFLQPPALADAYRNADILLSASWYESFPLFPLEAMACGLPVITTQYGTEEFAVHGETAEVVRPKDPECIADSLVRLVTRNDYRTSIAARGNAASKKFNWTNAVDRMESLLVDSDDDASVRSCVRPTQEGA